MQSDGRAITASPMSSRSGRVSIGRPWRWPCIAADRLGAGEAFATAMFARCFARGLPPRDEEDLLAVAASVGLSPSSLREEAQSDGVAEAHRQTLADALAAGAFGVPSFLTDDGALFWGQDRLVLLRAHLLAGR
jgi:2-hydroxychromene-2-carboxylate isomerase